MADLLARWTSTAWQLEVDAWVRAVLDAAGTSVLAPGVTVRARFWSVVRRYETAGGPVWLKECNPGQAFEGRLLQELAALEPGGFPAPLALDTHHGRVLLPDAGQVRDRSAGPWPAADLHQVLLSQAEVQHRLVGHGDRLAAAGLPSLLPAQVPAWFERTVEALGSLPEAHPQHLTSDVRRQLLSRRHRVREWCARLSGGPVPATFQHNDLGPGNTARRGGRVVCFDVGDAFWSHPFAVLQLPLALWSGSWPSGPRLTQPAVARQVDAYLDTWTTPTAGLRELRPLVAPALLLAQAHRCESWRRLLQHVPADRLGVATPLLLDHLGRLTA